MKRERGEIILAFIFLILFAVLVITAMGYNRKARRMPLVVGIPGVVLATVEVLRGTIFKRRSNDLKETTISAKQGIETEEPNVIDEQKRTLKAIGWMVLLVGMIWVFGFLISIPVYTFLFMKARKESWVLSVCITVVGFVMLYSLFVQGLHIDLYPGLLFKQ